MRVLIMMLSAIILLTGCATYADLGQGHVARTLVSEERSAFGTNMGFAKLQHCEKDKNGDLVNCKDLSGWQPMYSQGVGGQIAAGAMVGLGFGLGSAFSGASTSATATVNSATRGHGH